MHLTPLHDFDGTPICVGDVLMYPDGSYGMVFGDDKYGYKISTNMYNRDITQLSHWADTLDDAFVVRYHLVIDKGEWMAVSNFAVSFHSTYEEAKMSGLFDEPSIFYLTAEEVQSINQFNIMEEKQYESQNI